MKRIVLLFSVFALFSSSEMSSSVFAQSTQVNPDDLVITSIDVLGNRKVEREAILTLIESREGKLFDRDVIAEDIKELFKLGYFAHIKVQAEEDGNGVKLRVVVEEKPAISQIRFEGFEEIGEDDFSDKIDSREFTIVDESSIGSDLRIIEKEYINKGYYLAEISYELIPKGENDVELVFKALEGGTVRVGEVNIIGNQYFSDAEIIGQMFLQPLTRSSRLSGAGAIFQDDFLKRDAEFLSYLYKDSGFMDVNVSKPILQLDADRRLVRITMEVEEGVQYNVGNVTFSGDILFTDSELRENLKMETGKTFRISQFQRDVQTLVEKYGDLGYAFVDVNPQQKIHKDSTPPTIDINFDITKGEKVYFGSFNIVGNVKTRDNVIRRELEVSEGELYSGSKLSKSKRNIERLGFFEQVQLVRERDEEDSAMLNYTIRVKHKSTGQLQMALGFQPGQGKAEASWFGQGRYSEANQSGYGWRTNLSGKWNGERTYSLDLGFTNPRVDDGWWSLGFNGRLSNSFQTLSEDIEIQEKRVSAGVTVGRRIFERVRLSLNYKLTKITSDTDTFVLEKFRQDGLSSTATFSLSRNTTNNYLDPSEGTDVRISQAFTGGVLGGDFKYMESSGSSSMYYPVDFSETYRTYFHFKLLVSYIYPMGDEPVPILERYRLGGYDDLRGYKIKDIGPKFRILQDPQGSTLEFNKGGDKKFYAQFEYFMPLIVEAGIKGLIFADVGRVYDDDEPMAWNGLKKDFGFGMRWITPVAPFRFEWAYPYENGKVGDLRFIFYLGY